MFKNSSTVSETCIRKKPCSCSEISGGGMFNKIWSNATPTELTCIVLPASWPKSSAWGISNGAQWDVDVVQSFSQWIESIISIVFPLKSKVKGQRRSEEDWGLRTDRDMISTRPHLPLLQFGKLHFTTATSTSATQHQHSYTLHRLYTLRFLWVWPLHFCFVGVLEPLSRWSNFPVLVLVLLSLTVLLSYL